MGEAYIIFQACLKADPDKRGNNILDIGTCRVLIPNGGVMAKWGEGDPRWIVEERPDATNVNNWHWSEKDASKWSLDRLKALLVDVAFEADGKRIRINEVDKLEGEAWVNNRKAKLIYLYDWKITCKWEGVSTTDADFNPVSGTIEINGLSDEVDIEVRAADTSTFGYSCKDLCRKIGIVEIRRGLQTYVTELKRDFAKDLIKPVTKSPNGPLNGATTPPAKGLGLVDKCQKMNIAAFKSPPPATSPYTKMNSNPTFSSLTLSSSFRCEVGQLFQFFTVPDFLVAWSKCPTVFNLQKGSPFSLFDQVITGEVVDFVPSSSLRLSWRNKSWPQGVLSDVRLTFESEKEGSSLKLAQTGIPEDQLEATKSGWNAKIFSAIKYQFGVKDLS